VVEQAAEPLLDRGRRIWIFHPHLGIAVGAKTVSPVRPYTRYRIKLQGTTLWIWSASTRLPN
jgi:hypothetical protein